MVNTIKDFFSNPKVQAELHSALVTFLTVFFFTLSNGVSTGNLSRDAVVSLVLVAIRTAVKAVYQAVVSNYSKAQA